MNKREFWAMFWTAIVATFVFVVGTMIWWLFVGQYALIDYRHPELMEVCLIFFKKYGVYFAGVVSFTTYLVMRFKVYHLYWYTDAKTSKAVVIQVSYFPQTLDYGPSHIIIFHLHEENVKLVVDCWRDRDRMVWNQLTQGQEVVLTYRPVEWVAMRHNDEIGRGVHRLEFNELVSVQREAS